VLPLLPGDPRTIGPSGSTPCRSPAWASPSARSRWSRRR